MSIKSLVGSSPERHGLDREAVAHGRPLTGPRGTIAWAVFVLAALLSASNIGRGLARAREPRGRGDLVTRAAEYAMFRQGIYPNVGVAGKAAQGRYTVYPPYALPMFAAFFEPGGMSQGAMVVEVASLAALVFIGWYGVRELRFAGPALASVGAVATGACGGVIGGLWVGQFSLLCVGLIIAQIVCIERGRAGAAGLCWALAMLKPQIALPFALLFLRGRQWRGLVVGGLVLVALTLFACWWTGVSPLRLVDQWAFRDSLKWTASEGASGPGVVARALGLKPRDVNLAGLGLAGLLGIGGLWMLRARAATLDLLPLAGACGLLGELLFYHRAYDHVMLAPAMFAAFARVASQPTPLSLALATLVPATVWLPNRFFMAVPHSALGLTIIWAAAAAVLLVWAWRPGSHPWHSTPWRPGTRDDSSAGRPGESRG